MLILAHRSKRKNVGLALALFALSTTCLRATDCGNPPAVPPSLAAETKAALGEDYKLAYIRRDAILHETWGIYRSCSYPTQPARILRLTATDEEQLRLLAIPIPVIHAGEKVRLQNSEENLRMQLVGVAEQTGSIGERIRVHLQTGDSVSGANEAKVRWGAKLTAVVVGPHEAEIRR